MSAVGFVRFGFTTSISAPAADVRRRDKISYVAADWQVGPEAAVRLICNEWQFCPTTSQSRFRQQSTNIRHFELTAGMTALGGNSHWQHRDSFALTAELGRLQQGKIPPDTERLTAQRTCTFLYSVFQFNGDRSKAWRGAKRRLCLGNDKGAGLKNGYSRLSRGDSSALCQRKFYRAQFPPSLGQIIWFHRPRANRH